MQSLNLPAYDVRIRQQGSETCIYDQVRQTYVALTGEEWVRQHFVNYLTTQLNVPVGLIAVEKGFLFQGMSRRADIVVHDRFAAPWLVIECKAPEVPVNQRVFDQVGRYNRVIQAPYVGVTNGQNHYCFTVQAEEIQFLDGFPEYPIH